MVQIAKVQVVDYSSWAAAVEGFSNRLHFDSSSQFYRWARALHAVGVILPFSTSNLLSFGKDRPNT